MILHIPISIQQRIVSDGLLDHIPHLLGVSEYRVGSLFLPFPVRRQNRQTCNARNRKNE